MKTFFQDLPPFSDFKRVAAYELYTDIPGDWWLAIGDVAGSTKAIEAGRYKDVNTLGAAMIVAALNASKGTAIPFVFGGDGATLAFPPEIRPEMERALRATRTMAQKQFNMDLRVGLFSVKELTARGFPLKVAKYKLSGQVTLAMFRGEGFKQAELMLKDPKTRANHELPPLEEADAKFFEGLECRWNPITPKSGMILSLIVVGNTPQIIENVIGKIDQIMGHGQNPATVDKIPLTWPPKHFYAEFRVRTMGFSLWKKFKYWAWAMFIMVLAFRAIKKGGKLGDWDAKKYIHDLANNSDHRKFDEALRMILDCTNEQADQLEKWLEAQRLRGDLTYGIYRSSTALMTCLVFSWENHVHFIDGSDGGYALAAKQLKAQSQVPGSIFGSRRVEGT